MAGRIEHVVIIVKENHTFDNYFGTFPGANGATLAHAQNPPPGDPDHRHQAWMNRNADTAHRVQYTEAGIPGYFDLRADSPCATTTFPKLPARRRLAT